MTYTPHNKRGPQKPQRDWYEKLTLGTAIVGVAVVAISAAITAWMAVSIQGQLNEMRQASAIDRPYVFAELQSVTIPAIGKNEPMPRLQYVIRNAGREPALITALNVSLFASKGAPPRTTPGNDFLGPLCNDPKEQMSMTVPSGGEVHFSCSRFVPFTRAETDQLRTDQMLLWIMGTAFYAAPSGGRIYDLTIDSAYDRQRDVFVSFQRPELFEQRN